MAKEKKSRGKEKAEALTRMIKKDLFSFLAQQAPNRSFNWKQIATGAGIKGEISGKKFITLLESLVRDGKLDQPETGKYALARANRPGLTGIIDITREGFGFVQLDDKEEEVFISASGINRAFPGDKVKIRIIRPARKGSNQKAEGEVAEILERARNRFVGTVKIEGAFGIFIPDNPRIPYDFLIRKENTGNAKPGEKVLVEILGWTHLTPEGKVVEVLGKTGENETEMHAILYEFGFDPKFPVDVEEEAEKLPKKIAAHDLKERRDFRSTLTFTIDPVDAKDFDDAISYRELDNGNIEVGVHIADVSHYVQPGSRIDDEAWHRATSVYLVDRTVPMLPEVLSNQLCSLRPDEDKLTFSAVFEMTREGKMVADWFGKTVIHSRKRFTYEEAQGFIESGEGEWGRILRILNEIAHVLRRERFMHGSIAIEEDEVKFHLDEKGRPIGLYRKVRMDAHKLIEDYMLLANRKVTEEVAKMRKEPPLAFVYRIHDRPDQEKLTNLKDFVKNFGYTLDLTSNQTIVQSLNRLMLAVEGKPEQHIVNSISIRSMAKAIYSTTNIGHYGLGFKHYTHFTSPIRRYPDLMVHRLLHDYLNRNYKAVPEKLERSCRQSSNMEKKAAEAERASVKYKQVEYLQDKVGKEFEALVSGVTARGIYAEIIESKCEGMISMSDLADDFYEYDEKNYCIRGRRTGHTIHLGDPVTIRIASANLDKRLVDFELVSHDKKIFSRKAGKMPGRDTGRPATREKSKRGRK